MTRLRVLKLGGYFNSSTPSSSTLVDILRQCPELEELAFRNIADIDSNPCLPSATIDARLDCSPNSRIALPKLKSASFYYSGIAHTVEIMRHITFPNLESLELAYLENITPLLNIVYTQALTRIPLKRLRIESCLFSELQLINLLRKLPSLVTLELVDLEDFSGHSLKVSTVRICTPYVSEPFVLEFILRPTMDPATVDLSHARRMQFLRLGFSSDPH